jgi:hypothetical protein
MAIQVNVDNFRAAETALMIDSHLSVAGDVNKCFHFREPTPVEHQPVIRMNRDTLYSSYLVDISAGATLTLPDANGRYMSVMVVNEDHYINRVYSGAGTYELTVEEHGTPFVALSARTFVDAEDRDDVATVNALQDQIVVKAASAGPYSHPDYDESSRNATRAALSELGQGLNDTALMFGKKSDVEPTRHLIGTAQAWGGLPESEAYYYIETEPRQVGDYTLTLTDVPVDAFWSVTIYNRDGYFEHNPFNSFSVNSVTADAEPDGSFVLNLTPGGAGVKNHLYVMDGWNYALRLYRPRPEVIDQTWMPPTPQRVRAS